MITLDEAIRHCLEVAEQKETKAKYCFKTPWESDDIAKDCVKCAEEHRQLAEWLKDYKRLLKIDSGEEIKCGNCKYDGVSSLEICGTCFQYSNWEEV